jgi:hypothetical protein
MAKTRKRRIPVLVMVEVEDFLDSDYSPPLTMAEARAAALDLVRYVTGTESGYDAHSMVGAARYTATAKSSKVHKEVRS